MTTIQTGDLFRHLRGLALAEQVGRQSDRQLLERFTTARDEAAFEALVRRHGPMVLGVCRRLLHDGHDAEDAFQAAFLVLAQKAGSIGKCGTVGGFLYQVAYNLALKARARAAARQRRERRTGKRSAADPLSELTGRELLTALDEEMGRLPERWRAPLVLCYLEGKTRDEAARQLGWSLGTLKRRLEQGRARLRDRLERRGLGLPAALMAAGLATAALPAELAASTIRAARQVASGQAAAVSAPVAALVNGVRAAGRVKMVGGILLVVGLAGAGWLGRAAWAPPAKAEPVAAKQDEPPPPIKVKGTEDGKARTIRGRVLGADGKPVAGARVAADGGLDLGRLSVERREKLLGDVKTDSEGRFSLPLPDARLSRIELLAGARGHGLAWRTFANAAGRLDVELRLPPEQILTGRLIDLQGKPAAKARLRPIRVRPAAVRAPLHGNNGGVMGDAMRLLQDQRRQQGFEFFKDSPLRGSSPWPATVTTDADGRFRLRGFGRGQEVRLVVEDDRFALQEVFVRDDGEERGIGLLPPRRVSGRIRAADTGAPIAGATIWVTAFRRPSKRDLRGEGHLAQGRSDAEGRFAFNIYAGNTFTVEVYPPRGQPYLGALHSADWPKGTVKQQVDFKLPRGVLVHGKVRESGSGKPVASAAVHFIPQRENNPRLPRAILVGANYKVLSEDDGRFQIVVPPGPGRLVAIGPNPDYVYHAVSERELLSGKAGGLAQYFHAVLPLDLRTTDGPKQTPIELRRAVTIEGRLVGPDGRPVRNAVLFVPGELMPPSPPEIFTPSAGLPLDTRLAALAAREGAFQLPNCDPDKTYRIFVLEGTARSPILRPRPDGRDGLDPLAVANRLLDGKANRLGAVVDVSAKAAAAGKPITVKLAACGSAQVRFLDARGKPAAPKIWLELLVKPGPSVTRSRAEGKPAAEAAVLASPYSVIGAKPSLAADAEGRILIPALIPGATYRIKVLAGPQFLENEIVFEKDFTAESGKQTKLDIGQVLGERPASAGR